jgi:hypothetical protein
MRCSHNQCVTAKRWRATPALMGSPDASGAKRREHSERGTRTTKLCDRHNDQALMLRGLNRGMAPMRPASAGHGDAGDVGPSLSGLDVLAELRDDSRRGATTYLSDKRNKIRARFSFRRANQDDLPRPSGVAEGRAQGDSVWKPIAAGNG